MRAKVLWSMMLVYVCLTGCEEQVAERKPPSGSDFADMRKGSSGPGIPGASAPTSRGGGMFGGGGGGRGGGGGGRGGGGGGGYKRERRDW